MDGDAALTRGRSDAVHFFDFEVSVPPNRALGTVTYPHRMPANPANDFLTVSATPLAGSRDFVTAVNRAAGRLAGRSREAVVFVHGYNTNFAEGLYRQAQISQDFGTQGISVNYSWPSAADFRAYAYDRESALFARDGLEQTLVALARSNVSRVVVIAHSMGAQLLMDTLRQMAIRGDPAFFRKLGGVVLVSPDLDVDVFRTQAMPLARLGVEIYVFVSTHDRALRFSSFLRGNRERVGSITDSRRLGNLPILVVDVSHLEPQNDPLQHFKAGSSPTMIKLMSGMGTAGLQMLREDGPLAGAARELLTNGGNS